MNTCLESLYAKLSGISQARGQVESGGYIIWSAIGHDQKGRSLSWIIPFVSLYSHLPMLQGRENGVFPLIISLLASICNRLSINSMKTGQFYHLFFSMWISIFSVMCNVPVVTCAKTTLWQGWSRARAISTPPQPHARTPKTRCAMAWQRRLEGNAATTVWENTDVVLEGLASRHVRTMEHTDHRPLESVVRRLALPVNLSFPPYFPLQTH